MAYAIGAFILALLLTLALASFLTPARWWRRPNVKALAVLAAGTWGIGSLLLALAPEPAAARAASVPAAPAAPVASPAPPVLPTQSTYLVFEDLNLRAAAGIHARRLALVPAGATVTTTGARDGDWWQVRAEFGKRRVDGWVSSLWLRRAEEAHR
ncbi:MAG: hypothetical protein JWP59_1093 [Massilia sp.]|jgi:hypothetical protein|nr:hypothetical protein [Massilia sp.]